MTATTLPKARDGAATQKGQLRRDAILDAAEAVFCERGYFGCSMRDVSVRAGAALGLIAHYFPTKSVLFEQVIERRLPVLHDLIRASMDAALAAPRPTRQSLIRAFVEPFLRIGADPGSDLHLYVRLTSHLMSSYRVEEITPSLQRLQVISELFSHAMGGLHPDMPAERFWAGIYLIEAALVFMTQDTGFGDDISAGHYSVDATDRLIDHTVAFFDGGFGAIGG